MRIILILLGCLVCVGNLPWVHDDIMKLCTKVVHNKGKTFKQYCFLLTSEFSDELTRIIVNIIFRKKLKYCLCSYQNEF